MPVPGGAVQAWELVADVGGDIDREDLLRRIEDGLGSEPFTLDEHYGHFSWGAEGAGLTIVLEVSTVVGGLAGAIYLVEKLTKSFRRAKRPADVEPASQEARTWLAGLLGERPENIEAESVHTEKTTTRVALTAPQGTSEVELNHHETGTRRMRKTRSVT